MDELLNHAPCGFLSFADDGCIRRINQTLVDMLGYTADELVGGHVERVLTIGSRIFYQTHWFPLVRLHGHAEEIFLLLRSREGESIGVLANAVRREREGETVYDCVLIRVRERQKFEDELLRAKRVAEEARAEMERKAAELEKANRILEDQAHELEAQGQSLEEQALELEAAMEEVRVANEDLLERNEEADHLREVAEDANRAKSAFLAVMSHELRTPLNAIAGFVQLLEMGIHGPVTEAQREALSRIERSQRRLLRLINDVLNLARIEAGRVDYQIEEVAVDEVLEEVSKTVDAMVESRSLVFRLESEPGLSVRADRDKFEQIMINLVGNAIKFTSAGGSITVGAVSDPHDPAGMVLIRVKDTGIGMSEKQLSSIFEPFVQVDTSRTRSAEGTGLGLAISHDLAVGMGGDLDAVSKEGHGSTFRLRLPRVRKK